MGLKQGWIKHVFGDHCEHVRGEAEKNKAVEVGGPLCRMSCQLHRPHIHPLPLSLVPSVICTCWFWMYYCLFPPTTSSLALSLSLSPSDCNRSPSLPALSMQTLLHAVHSLSAISHSPTFKETENCALTWEEIESFECHQMPTCDYTATPAIVQLRCLPWNNFPHYLNTQPWICTIATKLTHFQTWLFQLHRNLTFWMLILEMVSSNQRWPSQFVFV